MTVFLWFFTPPPQDPCFILASFWFCYTMARRDLTADFASIPTTPRRDKKVSPKRSDTMPTAERSPRRSSRNHQPGMWAHLAGSSQTTPTKNAQNTTRTPARSPSRVVRSPSRSAPVTPLTSPGPSPRKTPRQAPLTSPGPSPHKTPRQTTRGGAPQSRQVNTPTSSPTVEQSELSCHIISDQHGESLCPVCTLNDGKSWVLCDHCSRWFHQKCIGYTRADKSTPSFYCPFCHKATADVKQMEEVIARATSAPSSMRTCAYTNIVKLAAWFELPITVDTSHVRQQVLDLFLAKKVGRCVLTYMRCHHIQRDSSMLI